MADANRLAAALRYQQDMEGPVTMNPNIAEQGRKGRANMAPPTSVMDPRSRDYERRARETENFLIGADILAGALPFAPLAKGAVMAAGRYATPKVMQGMENYMGRTGMTLNAAPQDEALRLAQQRAALPVEQHGLGLPAGNTPQQRAAAMGFETPAYHGTASDVVGLNPSAYGSSTGAKSAKDAFWAAQSPETAIGYAHYAANSAPVRQLVEQANQYERLAQRGVNPKVNWAKYDDALRQAEEFEQSISGNRLRGQNVMPLLVNTNKANVIDAGGGAFVDLEGGVNDLLKKTKRQGKDVAVIKNLDDDAGFNNRATDHYGILNPDVLRSRFAAFDPFRRNAALAAALGVAAPDLLAEEK